MSIYVDGERSRQRLGFAKSLLNKLKMLGMRTKKLIYEGFLYRVDVVAPGLSKIAVTAPMGAAVVCSTETGMQLFTADYWLAGMTQGRDVYVLNTDATPPFLRFTIANNALINNVKFTPQAKTFLLGLADYSATNPTPGIRFFGGEFFWLSVIGDPSALSLRLAETYLNFYAGSGQQPKRIALQIETDVSGFPDLVQQPIPAVSARVVTHWAGRALYVQTDQLVTSALYTGGPSGQFLEPIYGSTTFAGLPSDLVTLLLQYSPNPEPVSIGNYAFSLSATDEPTILHVCGATSAYIDANYFVANPSMEPWKVFYSLYNKEASTVSTYPVNTTLLNTLSAGYILTAGLVDYIKVHEFMYQFLPWPNVNPRAASDSAMFHSPSGEVYVYTRKYGPIKFTTGGMTSTSVTVPSVVASTPGIRPEMYYVGSNSYICVCVQPAKFRLYTLPAEQVDYDADQPGVYGLYYGSPFAGWAALPMPDSGWRLLHVTIVHADNGDCTLLGVMTQIAPPNTYHLCVLEYVSSSGVWRRLSELRATGVDPNTAKWAVGLFGEGLYAKQLSESLALAPLLPQMPAAPYAEYAANLP